MSVDIYSVSVDQIALVAATAKTLLEVGTSSTERASVIAWWVDFDGVTSTAIPVLIEARRASAGVTTATTLAGDQFDKADGVASTTVKHSTSSEGAGTLSGGELHRVHPQTGFFREYPLGREIVVPLSAFWRIRCTAAAGVNATFGVIWSE